MVKAQDIVPPFLRKMVDLTQKTDSSISQWSEDGKTYIVLDEFRFEAVLKRYFKGTMQTFVRQLHFYGFRKVDVDEKVGKWGFQHEEGLFEKEKPDLIAQIRRKTKVDPESQKLASYEEVQVLKAQVSFLQQIIEELREHFRDLKSGDKKMKMPKKSSPSGRKRQRTKSASTTSSTSTFEELCGKISVSDKLREEAKLDMSFLRESSFDSANNLDLEIDNFSDLLSELEIDSENEEVQQIMEETRSDSLFEETDEISEAVNVICEATNVGKKDVEKIVGFLSKMSLQEGRADNREIGYLGCQKLTKLVPMQKVGVGAS